jgi:hypothetical protein
MEDAGRGGKCGFTERREAEEDGSRYRELVRCHLKHLEWFWFVHGYPAAMLARLAYTLRSLETLYKSLGS